MKNSASIIASVLAITATILVAPISCTAPSFGSGDSCVFETPSSPIKKLQRQRFVPINYAGLGTASDNLFQLSRGGVKPSETARTAGQNEISSSSIGPVSRPVLVPHGSYTIGGQAVAPDYNKGARRPRYERQCSNNGLSLSRSPRGGFDLMITRMDGGGNGKAGRSAPYRSSNNYNNINNNGAASPDEKYQVAIDNTLNGVELSMADLFGSPYSSRGSSRRGSHAGSQPLSRANSSRGRRRSGVLIMSGATSPSELRDESRPLPNLRLAAQAAAKQRIEGDAGKFGPTSKEALGNTSVNHSKRQDYFDEDEDASERGRGRSMERRGTSKERESNPRSSKKRNSNSHIGHDLTGSRPIRIPGAPYHQQQSQSLHHSQSNFHAPTRDDEPRSFEQIFAAPLDGNALLAKLQAIRRNKENESAAIDIQYP